MWEINITENFSRQYKKLSRIDRTEVASDIIVLRREGPFLTRPYADTLKNTKITNLKELRVSSKEHEIRVAFMFLPDQTGLLLCLDIKKSGTEKNFYTKLINQAEKEYKTYLEHKCKK